MQWVQQGRYFPRKQDLDSTKLFLIEQLTQDLDEGSNESSIYKRKSTGLSSFGFTL